MRNLIYRLIDRERINIQIIVRNVSDPFDNGTKREIVALGSIVLDAAEAADIEVGEKYTISISRERVK